MLIASLKKKRQRIKALPTNEKEAFWAKVEALCMSDYDSKEADLKDLVENWLSKAEEAERD